MKLFTRLNFTLVNSYNAHTILGINRQASQKQIKTAYYKLAKQYHPDNNPKDRSTDMFHKITKAYEILIEDVRNNGKRYQSSHKSNDFHKNQGKNWSDDEEMFKAYQNFKKKRNLRSDSFHKFMEFYEEYISGVKKDEKKKQNEKQSNQKHQNAQYEQGEQYQQQQQSFQQSNSKQKRYFKTKKLQIFIDVTLTEQQARSGVDRRLKYNKKIICLQCKGKPHKRQTICKKCNGSGVKMMKHSIGVCYQCGGNKTVQHGDCNGCHGKGFFVKHAQQFVHIKSGVAHNDEIFVNGKGHQNQKNGYFGDLVIKIKIRDQRQQMDSSGVKKVGFNTFHTVNVSVFDAILGADIKYKTLWGQKILFLKSGTQDGAVIKRMGQGSRRNQNWSGDHFITIHIQIPKEITSEQEKIYKRIREIYRSKFPDL